MKLLVLAIIVLIGAIFLGLEIQKDPGTVVIQIRGWNIEASVALMAATMLVSFVIFYVAVRLASTTIRAPKLIGKYRQHRARKALNQGMSELAQGHWGKAQRKLGKATRCKETAILGYIGSAQAAQQLGKLEKRDKYLRLAFQKDESKKPELASGITEAQLMIENQQLAQAGEKLRRLYRMDPKNTLILKLLKECYLQSEAWEDLAQIMPDVMKYKVVSRSEGVDIERTAFTHILAKAANTGNDSRALDTAWGEVPGYLRRDKQMLGAYIGYLIEFGETQRPEVILRNKIKQQWDDDLVHMYGLIDSGAPPQQLNEAQRWVKRHSDSATLFLTLGRLALRNHLWSKARTYLEESIKIKPMPETYMLLGKLLEQTGETVIAGECFRKGLGISVGTDLRLERSPIEPKDTSGKATVLAPINSTVTLVGEAT